MTNSHNRTRSDLGTAPLGRLPAEGLLRVNFNAAEVATGKKKADDRVEALEVVVDLTACVRAAEGSPVQYSHSRRQARQDDDRQTTKNTDNAPMMGTSFSSSLEKAVTRAAV